MPWKKVDPMEERYRFVLMASQPRANFSELCRKFQISRKTGYKLLSRYQEEGLEGLADRSRRPKTAPKEVRAELICEIVSIRQAHPRWGGVTIRAVLERTHRKGELPCARTIDRILERCGLVEARKRRKRRIYCPETVVKPLAPNDVWTVDFKGWWHTKNGSRCVPLTIRDEHSRYLLDFTALSESSTERVKRRFEECFERYGVPTYIRSDNGAPFSAYRGLRGLSQLSVWWIKQGALPNRIPPASPQYNGAHERLHRDIKAELQKTPARTLAVQQRIFDAWREEFNNVRPHRSLNMRTPRNVYRVSSTKYRPERSYEYGDELQVRKVSSRGGVWWKGKERFLSNALAGEEIGIEQESDVTISLWFREFFLGRTDAEFSHPLGGESQ